MNNNRKLIEEARAWRDAGWFRVDNPTSASIITRLADALEAAEKAHTPTDDEREALATLLDELHGPWVTEGGCDFRGWRYGWRPGDAPKVNVDVVDPILSALRRSETVPS